MNPTLTASNVNSIRWSTRHLSIPCKIPAEEREGSAHAARSLEHRPGENRRPPPVHVLRREGPCRHGAVGSSSAHRPAKTSPSLSCIYQSQGELSSERRA